MTSTATILRVPFETDVFLIELFDQLRWGGPRVSRSLPYCPTEFLIDDAFIECPVLNGDEF